MMTRLLQILHHGQEAEIASPRYNPGMVAAKVSPTLIPDRPSILI